MRDRSAFCAYTQMRCVCLRVCVLASSSLIRFWRCALFLCIFIFRIQNAPASIMRERCALNCALARLAAMRPNAISQSAKCSMCMCMCRCCCVLSAQRAHMFHVGTLSQYTSNAHTRDAEHCDATSNEEEKVLQHQRTSAHNGSFLLSLAQGRARAHVIERRTQFFVSFACALTQQQF